VIVLVHESQYIGDVLLRFVEQYEIRCKLANDQRCSRPVAVVALITHLQCLYYQGTHVDRSMELQSFVENRSEDAFHPVKPGEHFLVVCSIAKDLSQSFIQCCIGFILVGVVLYDPYRHTAADDAGHGADCIMVMTGFKLNGT